MAQADFGVGFGVPVIKHASASLPPDFGIHGRAETAAGRGGSIPAGEAAPSGSAPEAKDAIQVRDSRKATQIFFTSTSPLNASMHQCSTAVQAGRPPGPVCARFCYRRIQEVNNAGALPAASQSLKTSPRAWAVRRGCLRQAPPLQGQRAGAAPVPWQHQRVRDRCLDAAPAAELSLECPRYSSVRPNPWLQPSSERARRAGASEPEMSTV
jgi:hypothetical protein